MEPDGDKATIVGCPSETVSVQFLWKRSIAGNWCESCIITRSPQSYVVSLYYYTTKYFEFVSKKLP